jgi:hypothetical protein
MKITTINILARNMKKEFEQGIKVVQHKNKDIWLIIGKDFYKAIKDNGIIENSLEKKCEK